MRVAFSRLVQSDLQMSGRRRPGFMFFRGLRMDFRGKRGGLEARRPKIAGRHRMRDDSSTDTYSLAVACGKLAHNIFEHSLMVKYLARGVGGASGPSRVRRGTPSCVVGGSPRYATLPCRVAGNRDDRPGGCAADQAGVLLDEAFVAIVASELELVLLI